MTGAETTRPAAPPGRVAVIIVAYNDPSVLERCLASLEAGVFRDYGVFLVDNSTNAEVEKAFAGRAGIWYLRTEDNLGFCEANNKGITAAMGQGYGYALLLNHDTVVEPQGLACLVAAAEAGAGRCIVTPKIRLLSDPGRLWYGGGYFSRWIGAGKNLGFNAPDDGRYDRPGEVTYATGCCMLVPMRAFREAGMLEPRMFMYLDDIEFCLRATSGGYRIRYEPSAVVLHELGSGSSLRKRPDYYLYFSIRNKPLVVRAWPYRAYLHGLTLLFAAVKAVQFTFVPGIPERRRKVSAIMWGAWDSLSSEPRHRRRFPRLFRTP